MNKQQIKAELRRSACEDRPMFYYLSEVACEKALEYLPDEYTWDVDCENKRIFFLLVAEAL